MHGSFPITGDDEADQLLSDEPLALLLGMLLDQQVPMEWAFRAPLRLKERLDGSLDATAIAALPVEELEELFRRKPSLHRFPGSMGKRTHQLCQHLVEHHQGRAADIWESASTGEELARRLQALPGFGKEKSQIFVAVLAKRFGVCPGGWEEAAGPFADVAPRSVADIDSRQAFARVREWKQAQKAAGRTKAE